LGCCAVAAACGSFAFSGKRSKTARIFIALSLSKPPPEAISAIARDQKKPEERREGTRARSGQNGLALDALAASGKHAGAMDGEHENSDGMASPDKTGHA